MLLEEDLLKNCSGAQSKEIELAHRVLHWWAHIKNPPPTEQDVREAANYFLNKGSMKESGISYLLGKAANYFLNKMDIKGDTAYLLAYHIPNMTNYSEIAKDVLQKIPERLRVTVVSVSYSTMIRGWYHSGIISDSDLAD